MGNVITRNSRTDRRRVFILGGKVGNVTRHERQLFKVKGQGHKVTHNKFTLSRALALVTLESKRPLIVVVRVRNHGVACAPRHRPISSCRRRDVQQWAQDRALAVVAPRAWNSLPDAIRRSPSLAVFIRSLKTHFYIQCFY